MSPADARALGLGKELLPAGRNAAVMGERSTGQNVGVAEPRRQPILLDLPDYLDGPRVRLQPYSPEDAPAIRDAVDESRERLLPWLPWAREMQALDDALAMVRRAQARWHLREDLTVGIFHRTTGALLGGSGLHRIRWEVRTFEIGYWIRSSAEKQGFITETVQVLTRFAFEHLAAERVEIRVDPRNTRSVRIPERLGFVREGTLRRVAEPAITPEPSDRTIYALVPADYARTPWQRT